MEQFELKTTQPINQKGRSEHEISPFIRPTNLKTCKLIFL